MTLDEVLDALFPAGHELVRGAHGTARGSARCGTRDIAIVAIENGTPLGVEAALLLAGHVLEIAGQDDARPILFAVATASQLMARRDELLGLNEYLSHLAKSLRLASRAGHPSIGLLHGAAAAGAFIATALATDMLVAVPGAAPSVMDLASIARVTKLPRDRLEEMAKSTPIFAPGIDHLAATGAVAEEWDDPASFPARLQALLDEPPAEDRRDAEGARRGGRGRAEAIAARVRSELA